MSIIAVARRARVSTATVSRVINGTASVAPKTAERVRNAIAALNFYPDVNARSLGSGRSGMYGLIISDITNPYFPELVKAFEDIAVTHDQEVLIANTNYDPQRMETCVTRMLQRKVDGVAIMTSEMDDHLIQKFSHRQIPLVFMDALARGPNVSVVHVDYVAGITMAMRHLFELNHRDIGFISGPITLQSAAIRMNTYRDVLQQEGIAEQQGWLQEGDHRVEGGALAMDRLLASSKHRPTALIASNDLTAIGAMGSIHKAGLRIPEDISVIGFDGIELSAYTQPALTTLFVSRRSLAEEAFRSLHRPKSGQVEGARENVVQPRLLIRESTAPAAKKRPQQD